MTHICGTTHKKIVGPQSTFLFASAARKYALSFTLASIGTIFFNVVIPQAFVTIQANNVGLMISNMLDFQILVGLRAACTKLSCCNHHCYNKDVMDVFGITSTTYIHMTVQLYNAHHVKSWWKLQLFSILCAAHEPSLPCNWVMIP